MTIRIADCELLRASLKRLVESSNFWEKLDWGASHGTSWERPFQFDWGYFIEKEIRERPPWNAMFQVGCERHGRVDIAISELKSDILKIALELKVWGNWWIDKRLIAGFNNDVSLVDNNKIPSAAVLICIFVRPPYDWMLENPKTVRFETVEELRNRMSIPELVEVGSYTRPSREGSRALELWVAARFNSAAQKELQNH